MNYNPEKLLQELIEINNKAQNHDTSVPLEVALDDELLDQWITLKRKIHSYFANKPS